MLVLVKIDNVQKQHYMHKTLEHHLIIKLYIHTVIVLKTERNNLNLYLIDDISVIWKTF